MKKFTINNLGKLDYESCWELQKERFQQALEAKKNKDVVKSAVLFVEHNPVYTLGKSADQNNILFSENLLGAKVFRIERGGDVTFHGPGQLVIYPIIDLEQFNLSLREYVFKMEELIIRTIARYGLKGKRAKGAAGVWLDIGKPTERKIAALGVKASRHITMHGLAFNINTDLAWFDKINPCGFQDKGVTSLAKELGTTQDFKEINEIIQKDFERLFV